MQTKEIKNYTVKAIKDAVEKNQLSVDKANEIIL